ncbi:MAG: cyclic nucleotide-binding domain-containing protein [Armatimonadetes bacterium]|nr:cyclic nucleotide-binding domain-containing protein [Armatimonadota bacterium]
MSASTGIQASYIAQGLSAEQVNQIAAISEIITVVDGAEIISEFDSAADIFVLIEGKVRVTTNQGDPIARLDKGAIIGEIALFDESERSATVVSAGESQLVKISGEKFTQLMYDEPTIGVIVLRNIGKTLCQRLRSSNVQLESVLAAL